MEPESPLAGRLHLSLKSIPYLCLAWTALALFLPSPARADDTYGPNLLTTGNFEDVQPTYVPWAGVDDQGNLHGIDANIHGNEFGQNAVDDSGHIGQYPFGPSVALGNLRGNGLTDLIVADAWGYFWYYPNSGTAQKPAFTQGEIIPIWLGEEATNENHEGIANIVPRIQLVDFEGSKLLDLVAGTYAGKLFRIPNLGATSQPDYKPTLNLDLLKINTRRKGVLWSNYLAPCFTGLFGSNSLSNIQDLVVGEGTYSANSLYLLRNTGSAAYPTFDEDHTQKIIPGMGLEQLTPAVVDWNNDGKPDVICGDRTGYVNLYLNTSKDPSQPTFATGTRISIGGQEKQGDSITVTIGDLTGNHLPNLIIGKADGTIVYALNTGKLGEPSFTTPPTPLTGVLPPNYHYVSLKQWRIEQAFGVPDELLAAVNSQLEPGFAFPDGVQSKYAMKFSVWPVKNTYFPVRYYPPVEDFWKEHVISCFQGLTIKINKRYRIHFWVKADHTVQEFRCRLVPNNTDRPGFHPTTVENAVDAGSGWTEITEEFKISDPDQDDTLTDWPYNFEFRFHGQSTFYVDDIQVQEELN